MKSHNIKHILEERTIEVSENSWEKLASQLDANDQKKKRTDFYQYAACLALLVGFILFMITKDATETAGETVVETEKNIQTQDVITSPSIDKEEITDKLFKDAMVTNEESFHPKKITTENNGVVAQKKTSRVIQNKGIATELTPKEKEQLEIVLQKEIQNVIVVNKKEILPKVIETIIAQKEVMVDLNKDLKASIAALSATENVAITDEEIDKLLKDAQQSFDKLDVKETLDLTTFATADDLLNEVEYELDMSFKQKVFELIKHKIEKTRTAVVDP